MLRFSVTLLELLTGTARAGLVATDLLIDEGVDGGKSGFENLVVRVESSCTLEIAGC